MSKSVKMPKRCVIVGCPNVINKQHIKHVFEFPQIETILTKWIEATGRTNWTPNKGSAICEIHFKPECFSNTNLRKRLKPDTVPTEHLLFSSCMTNRIKEEAVNEEAASYKEETSNELTLIENSDNKNEIKNIISIIDTGTEKIYKNKKQKTSNELENFKLKLQKIEEENNKLQAVIQSQQDKYEQRLKCEIDILKTVFEEEKKKYQKKMVTKNKQLNTLRKQVKRHKGKIKDLLTMIKNVKK